MHHFPHARFTGAIPAMIPGALHGIVRDEQCAEQCMLLSLHHDNEVAGIGDQGVDKQARADLRACEGSLLSRQAP